MLMDDLLAVPGHLGEQRDRLRPPIGVFLSVSLDLCGGRLCRQHIGEGVAERLAIEGADLRHEIAEFANGLFGIR